MIELLQENKRALEFAINTLPNTSRCQEVKLKLKIQLNRIEEEIKFISNQEDIVDDILKSITKTLSTISFTSQGPVPLISYSDEIESQKLDESHNRSLRSSQVENYFSVIRYPKNDSSDSWLHPFQGNDLPIQKKLQ